MDSRSTNVSQIFGSPEVTGNAVAAFVALRIVAAIHAFSLGYGPLDQLFLQQLDRHFVDRVWILDERKI